jgi:hypothetical protein
MYLIPNWPGGTDILDKVASIMGRLYWDYEPDPLLLLPPSEGLAD